LSASSHLRGREENLMKRHLLGIIIFSLIVCTMIFVTYYFVVLPKRSEVSAPPVHESTIKGNKENPAPVISKMRILEIRFSAEMQKFNATVDCKNTNPDKPYKKGDWGINSMSSKCASENKLLHFFVITDDKAQYLFTKATQRRSFGPIETSGHVFIEPFDFEPLLKLKPFRNIYVMAEDKSDYKKGSTPTFVPELAVRIVISYY
jgi:hypothetical protein